MGKISPVSAKYIIHTFIAIDGVVDSPDVIGAIFGQTEGLLGSELELRELQRSGRIGRIEVNTETKAGKTAGNILVPTSLDKAETAIIGAALETIQRIGPCTSRVKVEKIEDVGVSKRSFVIERAKELLRELTSSVLPDSQEITDEVAQSVRMMEISEYGAERLPAGPGIDESEEIIVVEGRADVLNLLKQGIKNVIALNGTNVPQGIIEISKKKVVTLFVDGDRGGDLIIKEVSSVAEVDYVIKAPDGKEVEELTKKEIHKALRAKVAVEQAKLESTNGHPRREITPSYVREGGRKPSYRDQQHSPGRRNSNFERRQTPQAPQLNPEQRTAFKDMLDNLVGTRGAYVLDEGLKVLGKVPTTELASTMKNVKSAYAVVFDGTINKDIAIAADHSNVRYVVGMSSRIRPSDTKATIFVGSDL